MIPLNKLNTLSTDEKDMLLCIFNMFEPRVLPYEMNISLISAMKPEFLQKRLTSAGEFVRSDESAQKIYTSLCEKLK